MKCERVFSKLKMIKKLLRSMLGQENLDSLMIINVERDITVSVSKIIQRFAQSSKHMANYLF